MRKSADGFTLMEVMITVVIVGILAAVAYPGYTQYVTQTRRSDATIALTQLAAQQEKYFTECGGYAGGIAGGLARVCPPVIGSPAGTIGSDTVSLSASGATRDGYYQITILPGPTGTLATSYLLTATPLVVQLANDGGPTGNCTTLTLNSTGVKFATGAHAGPNGGRCWRR